MSAFQYVALDANGRNRKGILEGDTPRQVRQQLREKGLVPIRVESARQRSASGGRRLARARGRLSATDLALLTRQLATLLQSGLPVEEALHAVAEQAERGRNRSLLLAIRGRVLEGHDLAAALGDYPGAFPELYRATVAAGEQSGHLDVALERLADYTEARQQMRQKMMLALLYPVLLTGMAIVVVVALLAYVVPQVVQVFDSIGQELPLLTRLLLQTSAFLQNHGLPLLLILVVLVITLVYLMRRLAFRRQVHRLLLRLPIAGRLNRSLNTGRYTRTLSILLASSVPVLEAMRIAAQVVSNVPMREALQGAAVKVREGSELNRALRDTGHLPPMALQLITSGEAGGNLEQMLDRAATQQDRETETIMAAVMGLFEPLLILVMGAMVLVIVLAILLPIFDLNQMVR